MENITIRKVEWYGGEALVVGERERKGATVLLLLTPANTIVDYLTESEVTFL